MFEDDGVSLWTSRVFVGAGENVEIKDDRKLEAGSRGPIGGRENF
jgi:hypothetical protein